MKSAVVMNDKAIVSSRGQVVIPKKVRDTIGIHAGNELIFTAREDGVLEVRLQKRTIEMFFGRCKRKKEKALSIEEMDKAIMQAVSKNIKKPRIKNL